MRRSLRLVALPFRATRFVAQMCALAAGALWDEWRKQREAKAHAAQYREDWRAARSARSAGENEWGFN